MNVLLHELKMLRGSFIAWTIGLLLLSSIYLSVYPAFARDADGIKEIFNNLPTAAKHAMGLGTLDMFSFLGFFANISTVFMLALSIQSMNIGITMTNRESLARTTDFLLTKPINRSSIFWSKFLASLTIIVATSFTFIIYMLIGSKFAGAGEYSYKVFWMIYGALLAVQLWFLSFGILIAQIRGRIRSVIGISLSIVMALFVIGLFGSIVDDKSIRYISPFKYFDLMKVVSYMQYDLNHILVWAIAIFGCCLIGWTIYKHKDIPTLV